MEFLCGGAHFSRQVKDMRLGLCTNIFHQTIIVVCPLVLLSRKKDVFK